MISIVTLIDIESETKDYYFVIISSFIEVSVCLIWWDPRRLKAVPIIIITYAM